MSKNGKGYYLTVGDFWSSSYLRDCESDHLEVAEYEAEQALQEVRSNGDETSCIRVKETTTKGTVYAAGYDY